MLNDLAPLLPQDSALPLRLDSTNRPHESIGAEMELALLWGVARVADIEIEPTRFATRGRPDSYSANFFPDAPAVIEITTVSDAGLLNERAMRNVASRIIQLANRTRKGSGRFLYFRFVEMSGWKNGQYHRRSNVSEKYVIDRTTETKVAKWILGTPNTKSLRITDSNVDVVIEREMHPQSQLFNTQSGVPPITYNLRKNPVYRALRDKRATSLAGLPPEVLRCIFIVDGGCDSLRLLSPISPSIFSKSGKEIIEAFLSDEPKINLVCVFSAKRGRAFNSALKWAVTNFPNPSNGRQLDYNRINKLVQLLPPPQFEGYQARQLQQQQSFSPRARGLYEATTFESNIERSNFMTVKLSSKALQDFLAGRITEQQFRYFTSGGGKNPFTSLLETGYVISSAKFESGGLDKDDDFIVLEFEKDATASSFDIPRSAKNTS
jgi:hypothetical protein